MRFRIQKIFRTLEDLRNIRKFSPILPIVNCYNIRQPSLHLLLIKYPSWTKKFILLKTRSA